VYRILGTGRSTDRGPAIVPFPPTVLIRYVEADYGAPHSQRQEDATSIGGSYPVVDEIRFCSD
jgi:hypothetical protein